MYKALVSVLFLTLPLMAETESAKIKFNYPNADITAVIAEYSQASGKRFVVDSTVRGKITLINKDELTLSEAYNQLSEALALNGFAIINQKEYLTVRNARSAQRDNLPVFSENAPAALPQRMIMFEKTLKNISADEVQKELRLLTSSYGEMSSHLSTNKIILTDWSTNINRIDEVLKRLDKPVSPAVKKIVEAAKRERKQYKNHKAQEEREMRVIKKHVESSEPPPEKPAPKE